jgi:Flp pilus assembly protein TadD
MLVLNGCGNLTTARAPARIEIEESVGFTITEESRISNGIRTDYDKALDYLAQGRHEEGIALLEAIVEAAPQLSAPRVDLGIAHHRAGNLEAAESNLLAALRANPEHPVAHNELGIVFRKTGRIAEARQSYEAALAIYPGYHYARRNLAVLCDMYFGDLKCALENYEAYMATVPGDEEAAMWIADVRNRIAQ